MSKVLAITLNTFREAIRNRILYIILIFALLILGSSILISDLAVSSHERIIKDLGLASINFFGLLIAILIGIGLVYNEMDKKTIYTIISKPIDRYQFILGKYFGLLLTIYVNILIMTLFFFAVLYFRELVSFEQMNQLWKENPEGGMIQPSVLTQIGYVFWSVALSLGRAAATLIALYHHEVTRHLLTIIVFGCMELAIITAFAVLYSTFTTPTLSAVFTFLTFVIGRLNEDVIRFAWRIQEKGVDTIAAKLKSWIAVGAAHITPNLQLFNKRALAVVDSHTVSFDPRDIVYAVVYCALVLVIATYAFKRKDFK